MYKEVIEKELIKLIETDITEDIIFKLMARFDNEIVAFEDFEDPMRPSLCREEFEAFLRESIKKSIKIKRKANNIIINFGVGDKEKLGLDEALNEETTDCLKIVGTIINGIMGRYVLVFAEELGQPVGRTGKAFLLSREDFDERSIIFGWPQRPDWRFSNFRGIPDFFDVELDMDKYIKKITEALK